MKCVNCDKISRNLDFFMDLSLDIPIHKPVLPITKIKTNTNSKTAVKIAPKILEETKSEKLETEDIFNEKFIVIDTKELKDFKFPDFDNENYELYEPIIDINIIKNPSEKVLFKNLLF